MQFDRVVGNIDKKLLSEAETILTKVFLELGANVNNDQYGTLLGGDPLVFALLVPCEHVATLNIPTAATDGVRFYWNPKWIVSKNLLGNRLTAYHESGHAIYMHPQRKGNRIAKLWNIAVDYIVNGMMMEDLKIRLKTDVAAHNAFVSGLGNYLTLEQCIAHFKDPFNLPPGFENFIPEPVEPKADLPGPMEDRELTEEEKEELSRRSKTYKCYYADPKLPDHMKRPEKIYDLLFSHLPKCPECGSVGVYPFPDKGQSNPSQGGKGKSKNGKEESQKQGEQRNSKSDDGDDDHHCDDSCSHDSSGPGQEDGNEQGGSSGPEQSGSGQPGQKSCSTCGGGFNILDFGDTVDEHLDAEAEPEELAKKLSDAIKTAKQMAGRIPQGLEDELGILMAPRIRWQDFIRTKLAKVRAGNSKNDWSKFRVRPMFAGLMIPKRINCIASFGCLLDTSGSMSKEDMAFGISQLASLDERSEGVIVPADAQIYWKQATKIRSSKSAELAKVKIVGRGGTKYAEFFRDYQKHIGKKDFLIVVTDGFLLENDVKEMTDPGVDVIWLITSGTSFNAPFGRVFDLKSV